MDGVQMDSGGWLSIRWLIRICWEKGRLWLDYGRPCVTCQGIWNLFYNQVFSTVMYCQGHREP